MVVVVFGAAGFIGTYLIDELVRGGHQVIASDISEGGEAYYREQKVPYYKLDITVPGALDQLPKDNIEAVVHLACMQPANVSATRYDPVDYIRVNVIGTLNILEWCKAAGVPRMIYTCSLRNTEGMWASKAGSPIRERDGRAIRHTGEYAMFSISESAAVDCVEHYSQTFGLRGIIFRLPPVYGYGPHTEIFKGGKPLRTGFQIFIDNASQGKPLELWGDSSRGRDIVYVKDVVSAFVLALKSEGVRGLYNIASGKMSSLREEAECIAQVYWPQGSSPVIIERPEKDNGIEPYVYDISKAKREFGWSPRYSMGEMIADYKRETELGRFKVLVEKRRVMMRKQ
ncbi:MAG: NAD(P)-dependent oxidoreductase [Acidobacteriota bacterium]|nr:NAD(P)-dependent oxidoreductase [Acidobacteriota bacterium]